jgi:hypothetical protein
VEFFPDFSKDVQEKRNAFTEVRHTVWAWNGDWNTRCNILPCSGLLWSDDYVISQTQRRQRSVSRTSMSPNKLSSVVGFGRSAWRRWFITDGLPFFSKVIELTILWVTVSLRVYAANAAYNLSFWFTVDIIVVLDYAGL